MLGELPAGWPIVRQDALNRARRQAHAALEDEGRAARYLACYYRREGNYAGATFANLSPNDPYSFSGSDLLAVTMLSVAIPQVAVRRLIEPGPTSAHLSQLLRDDALAVDRNLAAAGTETLSKMSEFYKAVKLALAPVGVRDSDRWVTASKICARKRPALFPVRDGVVTVYLGVRSFRSYATDWQVFGALLEDHHLMARLRRALDVASAEDGVRVGDPNGLLRHLDVVLWMHASNGSPSPPSTSEQETN
jgi:hypothetical protein